MARNWSALFVTKGAQIFFDWSVDDIGVDGMSVGIFLALTAVSRDTFVLQLEWVLIK